jgi:DNA-binding CsgD family transcriptional regulator
MGRGALDNEQIKKEYLAGMSTYALAEKYGCTRKTIRNRLQKMGVEIRTGRSRLKLDDEQIKEDYLSTRNLTLVAEKHNCSPGTIKDRLQAMGITDTSAGVPRETHFRSLSTIKTRYRAFLTDVYSRPGRRNVKIEYDDTLPDTVEAVLDTLDDREATVLRLRYGLSGQPPMTLTEISNTLGISRRRVENLSLEGWIKLRHDIGSQPFEKYLKPLEDDRIGKLLQRIHTYLRRELKEFQPGFISIHVDVPEQVYRDRLEEYQRDLGARYVFFDVGELPHMMHAMFSVSFRPREENDE